MTTIPVYIDGPYGPIHRLAGYSSVVLFAGKGRGREVEAADPQAEQESPTASHISWPWHPSIRLCGPSPGT